MILKLEIEIDYIVIKINILISFPNHVAISPGVFANTDNSFDDDNNNIYSFEKDKELGDIVISIPYVKSTML